MNRSVFFRLSKGLLRTGRTFPAARVRRSSTSVENFENAVNALQHAFPVLPPAPPSQPTSFATLDLHPSIVSALSSISILKPTKIQTLAAEPLLESHHTLLAAETGAGKTLAYLAPVLSSFKKAEARALKHSSDQTEALISDAAMRPAVLILVPTRELSAQVHSVTKSLSHVGKFRVRAAMGGLQGKTSRKRMKVDPFDVLVATPAAVQKLRAGNSLYLSRVKTVVIDEADELLGRKAGFGEQMKDMMHVLSGKGVQFVYAAATLSGKLREGLERFHGGNLTLVKGDRLHRVADSSEVQTNFIRVDGSDEAKFRKVVEIVTGARHRRDAGKMLIFCNEVDRRTALLDTLTAYDVSVVHLSAEGTGREDRANDWKSFSSGQVRVAICSKSYGRGIDDSQIATVIMVDVPMTGTEYVHRVGRIRRSGRAYVLVGRRDHAMAEALFLGHVRGDVIAGLNARGAWTKYTTGGRDRIASDKAVRQARGKRAARWVDERRRAAGTFRAKGGRRKRRDGDEKVGSREKRPKSKLLW